MRGNPFRCSFKKGVARLAGGLFEIVTRGAGVFRDPRPADHAFETQTCGEVGYPFGVFAARFPETMIEVCNADAGVKLMVVSEFFDGQKKAG